MRYLEGDQLRFKYAADMRELIGKTVMYLRSSDIDKSGRGYFFPRVDKVEDVIRKEFIFESGRTARSNEMVEMVIFDQSKSND